MTFILAILGFTLAVFKTRPLAIAYCVLGILTIILAIVVGAIQAASYQSAVIFDPCYYSFLGKANNIFTLDLFILSSNSGIVLLIDAVLLMFSWAGSIVYIS